MRFLQLAIALLARCFAPRLISPCLTIKGLGLVELEEALERKGVGIVVSVVKLVADL